MTPKSQVIILNGTGSVGKSSVAQAFQAIAIDPFLHFGGDAFLEMLPKDMTQRPDGFLICHGIDLQGAPTLELVIGSVVERTLSGMRAAIAGMAAEGNNLIADIIMTSPNEQQDYRRKLGPMVPFFVGLHAPLNVIEQREKDRGDRMIGLARWQFDRVHQGMVYDLELDTSGLNPAECAQRIASAAGIAVKARP